MRTARQQRVTRGAATASAATFIALMSHLLGGGAMPGWLGIVLPWLLSLPAGMLLAGRRLSLWRLSASVVVSQVLFHLLFVLGTRSEATLTLAPHAGHAGHTGTITGPSGTHLMHADPSMWLWHGVAAALTIGLLHRTERIVAQLRDIATQMATWVRRRFEAADLPCPLRAADGLPAPGWSSRPPAADPLLASLRRRGPPLAHTA